MRTIQYICLLIVLLQSCKHPEKHETMEEKAINKVAESTQHNSSQNKEIDSFFEAYESNFNKGIKEGGASVKDVITSSFSNCFVESSPAGVICGKNDKSFQDKIEEGYTLYQKIGSKSMEIISKEITELNEQHFMVKVKWRYTAVKDSKEVVIEFENFYFLSHLNNEWKIFAYVAGDEQKALKEKGLI